MKKTTNLHLALIKNTHGGSLIQMMVSVAVSSIIMFAMMTMQSSGSRETKALAEKLSSLSLKNSLTTVFSEGAVCSALLSGKTVSISDANALKSSVIAVNAIPLSAAAGSPELASVNSPASTDSSSLKVKTIQFTNFTSVSNPTTTTSPFTADLVVTFNEPPEIVRAIQPIKTKVLVYATAGTISSCSGSGMMTPSICSSLGGSFDSNTGTCTNVGQTLANMCGSVGGSYNSSTGKCQNIPSTFSTTGGTSSNIAWGAGTGDPNSATCKATCAASGKTCVFAYVTEDGSTKERNVPLFQDCSSVIDRTVGGKDGTNNRFVSCTCI